jgi:hypothetical protein
MATYDPAKHVRSLTTRLKENFAAQKQGKAAKEYRNERTKYWRSKAAHAKNDRKRKAYERKARRSSELGAKIVDEQRTLIKRRSKLQAALRVAKKASGSVTDNLWGGSRGVTNEIIRIVGGRAPVTSRKRVETFGNPGSDHHVSQRTADAVDFGIANAYNLAREIARKLGGTWNGDYDSFTIVRKGKTFRVQGIAAVHGTGPHLHYGVRRA